MKRIVFLAAILATWHSATAADLGKIERPVDGLGFMKPIPVSITGFSGEADTVLRFDLMFMGFESASPDKPMYFIQKNGGDGIGAQITDALHATVYNKVFTGGSTRSQTHALADDISLSLTKAPGIARTRVAFKRRDNAYGVGEIYLSDYDGFNAQAVTRDNAICGAPCWAGHDMLLYMTHKLSDKPDILSHSLSTGARKTVAHFPGMNSSPAVSPDGRRVAMILSKSGSPDLWVSDLDGGNLKQLTSTHEDESSPCWSPDSRTICFVSRESGRPALYTIPAGGGHMQRLSIANATNPSEPDYSPDGKYLLFTVNRGGFQICITPLEGPLRGTATDLVAGEDPVWAPNSRAVMFVKNVNNRHVLALLDVPSKQTREFKISGDASQPSWAR